MKKLQYIFTLFFSALILFSCEYGDENVDPTRPSAEKVDLNLILPAAQAQAAFNNMAAAARLSGIIMQHFDGFDAQQNDYTIYNIDENALDGFWNNGLYGGVMKDCKVMIEKGTLEENPHYVGIAKVLMAHALGTATSIWGDVPYTEALKGQEILKPTYDSQESVYGSVQTLLDEAIVELEKPATEAGPAGDDLIYGGDASLWIATAHALKARYHMHLSKRDPNAYTSALAEIDLAFQSSADQPDFVFNNAAAFSNPFAQFGVQRPNTLVSNPGFVDGMLDRFDPRRYVFSGFDYEFFTEQTASDGGLFWSVNDAPSPIISYSELLLLRAEALARTGDLDGANTALIDAVTDNLDYVQAEAKLDELGGPGTGEDYINFYMSTVPDISGLSPEAAVEAIMIEAYVALYGQAELEIWTNYRRTGYPALTPNPNGSNGNNPSGVIPRRIIYPQNERITNTEKLQAAKDAQGGALLDDDLWAFEN